uniref:Uncharacterized protein n=1 Tax=Octopus bimaculoides TaxID=37653 RepID=A0A0L8H3J6_OCTBM
MDKLFPSNLSNFNLNTSTTTTYRSPSHPCSSIAELLVRPQESKFFVYSVHHFGTTLQNPVLL